MSELVATTSVVIPALNEERTIAEVVESVLADDPLEVIVIDSDSTDQTAREAQRAGATVVNWRDAIPELPPRPGKGEALWRGTACAKGEIVAFVDADLLSPRPHIVRDLVAPFKSPEIYLVKARYRRGIGDQPTGGGRVTELTAKPLLRTFFPALSSIDQPLSGEYALRRSIARELPFTEGYGVEIALLVDICEKWGAQCIAEVDLGDRTHRNRPLSELSPMADIVMRTVLSRVPELAAKIPKPHERPALAKISN